MGLSELRKLRSLVLPSAMLLPATRNRCTLTHGAVLHAAATMPELIEDPCAAGSQCVLLHLLHEAGDSR